MRKSIQELNLNISRKKYILIIFSDCTISLEIDNLLPPVLDIVETSGDRQQRAAAAEVLHSTLLMMIGKTSTRTEEMSEKLPMTEIFKRVLPTILNLASDPDSVVQE